MPRRTAGGQASSRAAPAIGLPLRRDLPSGTLTFMFTDIEGSTRALLEVGARRWERVLERHTGILRSVTREHSGVEVRTEGDSFFLVFRAAGDAVEAAANIQRRLATATWPYGVTVRVRIGMHSGEGFPATHAAGVDYIGVAVHHAARVLAAGHGGQVLLSSATRALLGPRLPDRIDVRDLGLHRLKDLAKPDHLYQLVIDGVAQEFPPLRTLDRARHDLPPQMTSFVGRERELSEVRALFPRTRALTLVGAGGIGKTRLALQVAAELVDGFDDGAWFVGLAAVRDPALVPSAIAATLRIQERKGASTMDRLREELREKRILLVLDNFEQVADAAKDVSDLLAAADGLRVIVTSRAPLRISGEQLYPVAPLATPDEQEGGDVGQLVQSDAVRLFIERAIAAKPDFQLTPQNAPAVFGICRRLDGLPLAIELAAARTKILTPEAIYARLQRGTEILGSGARDLPARQRTLGGAIAWSYDLLDERGKRLLRRLSVFFGSAGLKEIEQVAGPTADVGDVLEGLEALLDQSLVTQLEADGEPRFAMLEVVREYAGQKLAESGEAALIEGRHVDAYVDLTERAARELRGEAQKRWLALLDIEVGNLRAAMDRAAARRTEDALRSVFALWRFWQMRGHLEEGRRRAEQVLALSDAPTYGRAYVRALEGAGGVAYWQGDMGAAYRFYAQALEQARGRGDRDLIADALSNVALFYFYDPEQGHEKAKQTFDEAMLIYRELGDLAGIANVTRVVANTLMWEGRLAEAQRMFDEAVALHRTLGDRFGTTWALRGSAANLMRLGRATEAGVLLREALRDLAAVDDRGGAAVVLADLAEVARAAGDPLKAQRLRGASSALSAQTGAQFAQVIAQLDQQETTAIAVDAERTAWEDGSRMAFAEAVAYALEVGSAEGSP